MRLTTAIVVAACVATAAIVLRLDPARGGFPGATPEAFPLLFTGAFLCVAVLVRSRIPSGAWFATVAAAGLAAIEVLGRVRAVEGVAGPAATSGTGQWFVAVAELALIAAAVVAAGYATRGVSDWRRWQARGWRVLVMGALAGVIAVCGASVLIAIVSGAAAVTAPGNAGELSWLRISGRVAAGFVAAGALAGMWRDFSSPLARARSKAGSAADLPRALAEELLPRAAAFRDRGREEERARLAADLHALILPDLRRAARTAEAAGDVGQPLASELRHAVEGVERLMHERQSVVFEEFGLVAALEWLAERTQDQAPIDVVLELDGSADDPDALPKTVTRAAFRIAILAVDNIVRHAVASRVALELMSSRDSIALVIRDDGHGLEAVSGPARSRGRGLVDMRAAAQAVGGAVDVRSSTAGTSVEFRWAGTAAPAGDHAAKRAHLPDSPATLRP